MPADRRLNVVLCWHMHQPDYRDPLSGDSAQPWSYLRAIKDYTDMAAHLEQVAGAKAVINFAPVLLEQIDTYRQRIDAWFNNGKALPNPLLNALAAESDNSPEQRRTLLKLCVDGYHSRFGQRHLAYADLIDISRHVLRRHDQLVYLRNSFFHDLAVWHHLAWLGETVHRSDPRVQRLVRKQRDFRIAERRELLTIIGEQINAVIPRYRALADNGRVELSMSPYAHPIAPLLLDFASAREAVADLPLPVKPGYPGGEQRLRWQIDTGRRVFASHFGAAPQGCWPAEGAISAASLKVFADCGFRWVASGGGVLGNSLRRAGERSADINSDTALFRAWRMGDDTPACFFRDDGLSDQIGFNYASWHADDAVANLIHHLEKIDAHCRGQEGPVVSIIMDGENAWEHYPNNAYYFLQALYRRLANHPKLRLSTFSECLAGDIATLPTLVAGSWVLGSLTTWIGERDKNRAWEMLVAAKQAVDRALSEPKVSNARLNSEQRAAIERQLAICEGSDWFWWPGPHNPETTVADFDQLYRHHLAALYTLIKTDPPDYLQHRFTHLESIESAANPAAEGAAQSGVMRRAQ